MENNNFTESLELKELENIVPDIQKRLKKNQYLFVEFYYNLSLIVTSDNIYIESWEEGNYPMRNGLLQIMTSKEKEKYDDILYYNFKEDIENTYRILDNIFDKCKYTTVKCWEVGK